MHGILLCPLGKLALVGFMVQGPNPRPDIALQVGGEVHGILLWPLGGLAFVGHAASPARDLYAAVCGSLTHVPQARLGTNPLLSHTPDCKGALLSPASER